MLTTYAKWAQAPQTDEERLILVENWFTELRERPKFLVPMFALMIATAVMLGWYYSAVDFEWLKDHMLSATPRMNQMTQEQRDQAMRFMSKPFMIGSGIGGALFVIPTMLVIQTLYYWLAGTVTNVKLGFEKWLAIPCWSALPGVIGIVAGLVYLLGSGDQFQIGPNDIQVFSFNSLFFHRTMGEPGYTLLSGLGLTNVWGWILSIIAVRAFSQRSWAYATIVVMLPLVLIYGAWSWLAFRVVGV